MVLNQISPVLDDPGAVPELVTPATGRYPKVLPVYTCNVWLVLLYHNCPTVLLFGARPADAKFSNK